MIRTGSLLAVVAALALALAAAAGAYNLDDGKVGKAGRELRAQRAHSTHVIRFFLEGKGRRMIVPLGQRCVEIRTDVEDVATCMRAREILAGHRWLRSVARERLEALRPAAPAQPTSCGGSNVAIGRCMAAGYGWTGGEWQALYTLWNRESGWSTTANNPASSACGIPQAMNDCAYGYDPAAQIAWGLRYIRGRYGSPSVALSHFYAYNWY